LKVPVVEGSSKGTTTLEKSRASNSPTEGARTYYLGKSVGGRSQVVGRRKGKGKRGGGPNFSRGSGPKSSHKQKEEKRKRMKDKGVFPPQKLKGGAARFRC